MPTIIDSLVVELGFDASKMTQGQKEAVDSLRNFEDGARRHVDPVEKGFKDLLGTFKEVQGRLLAIGAIIAAGLGFNRMTQEVTKANSELGYLSKTLNMSAQDLSAWENVGRQVGATTGDISAGLRSINSEIQEFHATGRSQLGSLMGQLGIKPLQTDDTAESVAKRLSSWYVQQPDKGFASHLLQSRGGLSQGMINLLSLGPEEIQKRLDQAKRFAPTDQEIKQFQELTKAWGELLQVIDKLERVIVSAFTPGLVKVLNMITGWLDKLNGGSNPADVAGGVAAKHGFSELAPNAAKPSLAHRAWSWIKGKFGAGGEEGANQSTAGGGGGAAANDNAGEAAPGEVNGTLAEQRTRLAQELRDKPELRDRVMRIMANEQGSHPEGAQGIAESMLNRALVRGTSLEKEARWTSEGGYYQNGNMGVGALENDRHRKILEQALDRAIGGSNITGYATDNSSQGLAEREKTNGTFAWTKDLGRAGAQESFFGPASAEPMLARRWQAWKERTEAQEQARKAARSSVYPPWMPTGPGSATRDNNASQSFQNWRSLGLGSRGALMRGGDSSTTNNNTSSTSIHSMNVTVPHGADPSAYADGISRRLADYNNVQHSNTGLV